MGGLTSSHACPQHVYCSNRPSHTTRRRLMRLLVDSKLLKSSCHTPPGNGSSAMVRLKLSQKIIAGQLRISRVGPQTRLTFMPLTLAHGLLVGDRTNIFRKDFERDEGGSVRRTPCRLADVPGYRDRAPNGHLRLVQQAGKD